MSLTEQNQKDYDIILIQTHGEHRFINSVPISSEDLEKKDSFFQSYLNDLLRNYPDSTLELFSPQAYNAFVEDLDKCFNCEQQFSKKEMVQAEKNIYFCDICFEDLAY